MAAVVRFENVSKKFILQHQKPKSFQEALVNFFHRRNGTFEEFWALRDVCFEIQPGETLGIIGENGSGKSTILKLITRILEPTTGKVHVDGKVSALIELGAGFHPDLTGRENIYLNGSILGLSRKEMDRRFEEIVTFSELERFIDTPVKHYSSGMYMRLGFSVAISVDPDILIVDEVLAVGDEVFQRKCLDRINEFRRQGKTIIFVSHTLGTVEQLCDRVMWLHEGMLKADGIPAQVIQHYVEELQDHDERNREREHRVASEQHEQPPARSDAEITEVKLLNEDRVERYSFRTSDTVVARLGYRVADPSAEYAFGVELRRGDGLLIYRTLSDPLRIDKQNDGGYIEVEFPDLPLLAGTYDLVAGIWRSDDTVNAHVPNSPSCRFSVWSDLVEAGVVALQERWLGLPETGVIVGAGGPVGFSQR